MPPCSPKDTRRERRILPQKAQKGERREKTKCKVQNERPGERVAFFPLASYLLPFPGDFHAKYHHHHHARHGAAFWVLWRRGLCIRPAIDAIAEDGFKFTRYFTTSPVCSPSRGPLLTGRYPQSNGLIGLTHSPWNWRFNEGERHLSHILRGRGAITPALFGLQHEASNLDDLGFDVAYAQRGETGGRANRAHGGPRFADFLSAQTQQAKPPFYAQVGFFETHRPHALAMSNPTTARAFACRPISLTTKPPAGNSPCNKARFAGLTTQCGSSQTRSRKAAWRTIPCSFSRSITALNFPRAKFFCYDPGHRHCPADALARRRCLRGHNLRPPAQ